MSTFHDLGTFLHRENYKNAEASMKCKQLCHEAAI